MKRTTAVVLLGILVAGGAGWAVNRAIGQADGRQQTQAAPPGVPYREPPVFPSISTVPMPVKKDESYNAKEFKTAPSAVQQNSTSAVIPVQFRNDTFVLPPAQDADAKLTNADSLSSTGLGSATGRQESAVSLEWVGPVTMKIGQTANYQLIVKNTGVAPVQGVVVKSRIPGRAKIVGTKPKATTEVNSLSWELGTLQPHQEQRLDMQILAESRGDMACQAHVTFTGAAMTRVLVREPKLVVKATAGEKALVGDVITITVTVSNVGDCSAEQVRIRAMLPEGLEHSKGRSVEFDIGNLAPNDPKSVQLVCVAKGTGRQVCEATATADGNLRSQDTANIDIVAPRIDLTAMGPKLRYLDRKAVYNFRVTNPGSAPASNVMVSDLLPDGFKFVRASDGGRHDFATRTVSWFIGDLSPGQTREVSMEAIAASTGEQKHKATVSAARGLRGEVEIATRVEGLSALLMELVDLDDPVEVGADTAYEVRVTNTGSKTETNLQLVCIIPDKMEFRGAHGAGDCKFRLRGKELVFEPLPQLAPRTDATYRVNVRGIAPGDLRFRARIMADGLTDPVLKEESTKVYGD